MPYRLFLAVFVCTLGLSAITTAQTNSFPLYSSGAWSGTANPDGTGLTNYQLKLQASSGYNRILHLSADPGISTVFNFETGKDVYWGEATDAGNYWFRGRNIILQTSKLGINYSTPVYPLDVAGQVGANGLVMTNKYPGSSLDLMMEGLFGTDAYDLLSVHRGWDPKGVYIAGYNASNATVSGWSALAAQHVYIGTNAFNNTNYVYVNLMNGSVGIGTSNTNDPNYRLFVETGIRTRRVTVDQATWPDYVFSPGYRLPKLDNLERYIATNHHLPEMPTADSVAAHGVELGAGQAALLKKVEELTLYVIDLNKKNERLEKEVEALKKTAGKRKDRS